MENDVRIDGSNAVVIRRRKVDGGMTPGEKAEKVRHGRKIRAIENAEKKEQDLLKRAANSSGRRGDVAHLIAARRFEINKTVPKKRKS